MIGSILTSSATVDDYPRSCTTLPRITMKH